MTHLINRILGAVGIAIAVMTPFSANGQSSTASAVRKPAPIRVLFIGNSVTYVNNLPLTLKKLADAEGSVRPIENSDVTVGNATLETLWHETTARNEIQNGKWDYVVLQAGPDLYNGWSQTAMPERTLRYARRFDEEIKKSGAKTVFFVTWAMNHAGGPVMWAATQEHVNSVYLSLAKELNALIAPVGPAFELVHERAPSVQLNEGYSLSIHPGILGTELAACVFYIVVEDQAACPTLNKTHTPDDKEQSISDLKVIHDAATEATHGEKRWPPVDHPPSQVK